MVSLRPQFCIRALLLSFVVLISMLAAGSGQSPSGSVPDPEYDDVYNLEHEFGRALIHKDKQFLSEHLADSLVEIAWNGLVFTKGKLLSDIGYIDVSSYDISNVKFRELEPGAILLTYDLEMAMSAAGKAAPTRGYASSIWVKRDGRWVLQMHQTTPAEHH